MVVPSARRNVLAYTRLPEVEWLRTEYVGQDPIPIPVLGAEIGLDDIYEGVQLPPLAVGEGEEWEAYGDWEGDEA